jgi:hypothetical protein
MSSNLYAMLLYIAPLLPASVALTYIISVIFRWEQTLARRISGSRPHDTKNMKVSLPYDETDTKLQEEPTWTSQIMTAAVPIAHHSYMSMKLWNMDRSETTSINVCLIQIAITMAEFAIGYFRHHERQRGDLFALGPSWGAMALRSQSPMLRSGLTGITSSVCIATLGIISILPEQPTADQGSSTILVSKADKLNEADSSPAKSTTSPRSSNIHLHMFSVSLLLVYLIHDYQSISSTLLYRYRWMGASPHLLLVFGLLLVHSGVQTWQTTSRPGQTVIQHLKAFASQAYPERPASISRCVFIPLSIIGAWVSLFFVSSYLTSCLGFRKSILGRPRTMPRFLDGGVSGGFIYHMVVPVQLFLRRDQIKGDKPGSMFRFMMAFVTAFGQTITGLAVVAIGLYVLRIFDLMQEDSRCCCSSAVN